MILFLLQSDADPAAAIASVIVFLVLALVGFVIYFIPSIIAMLRGHPNAAGIMVVNLLLGWICIGWIVALVWSVTAIDESRSYR